MLRALATASTLGLVSTSQSVFAQSLEDALAAFNGQEVSIEGTIGDGSDLSFGSDDDVIVFRNPEGVFFKVVFDAGREARKQLDGCEFRMFGGGSPCAFKGMAEISVDGSRIELIVFSAEEIGEPVK